MSVKNVFIFFQQLRIHHWIKNLLIFFPLVFSNNLFNREFFYNEVFAFFCFSLVASGVYVMNDVIDRKHDAFHPIKSKRPIAQGCFPLWLAVITIVILLLTGLLFAYVYLNTRTTVFIASYIILNIFYSTFLKQLPPLDILTIASFYIVRPIVGSAALGVSASSWMIITTFFAALCLIALKRKAEIALNSTTLNLTRKNIQIYNNEVLNMIFIIGAASAIMSYVVYSISFPHLYVLTVIPLVGLITQIIIRSRKNILQFEMPEIALFRDKITLFFLVVWSFMIIAYHLKY